MDLVPGRNRKSLIARRKDSSSRNFAFKFSRLRAREEMKVCLWIPEPFVRLGKGGLSRLQKCLKCMFKKGHCCCQNENWNGIASQRNIKKRGHTRALLLCRHFSQKAIILGNNEEHQRRTRQRNLGQQRGILVVSHV